MDSIHLRQTLPLVFADCSDSNSDIWQRDVIFKKGKSYLIEAASGTGKSSLCSYLYGNRNDYQGSIYFDEHDIRALCNADWTRLRRYSLSMLFQDLRLFPRLTALENVLLKNCLTGYKKKEELIALFEELGIADKINTPVSKLSYGQQQRVAFIRCLCQPMDFILLDEPISHLDKNNAVSMARLLTEETNRQGTGIIVTSIGNHLEINYHSILKL